MEFSLINGSYPQEDAIDILTRMIQVKINFHKGKIDSAETEEEKQSREKRIEELHDELEKVKAAIMASDKSVAISSQIRF